MARDDEQVWAELVESFHSSADVERPQWPDAENVDTGAPGDMGTERAPGADRGGAPSPDDSAGSPDEKSASGGDRPTAHRPHTEHDPEGHYIPPTPPPVPSTDLITRLAWLCVLGTPVFFLLAVIVGQPVSGLFGALGAGAFIGGFVLLVMRLRGHDPYDPDDGAVV